jgi:hypothetical protein
MEKYFIRSLADSTASFHQILSGLPATRHGFNLTSEPKLRQWYGLLWLEIDGQRGYENQ